MWKRANQLRVSFNNTGIVRESLDDMYLMHCMSVYEILEANSNSNIEFGDHNLPKTNWLNIDKGLSVEYPESSSARNVAQEFGFLNSNQ